jgi:biotin operon repressor
MSLLKYIDRLKRMDDLIRRKATGCTNEFAEKLNISRSQLLQDLKELRELGAPIEFCPISKSYLYTKNCTLSLDFLERADAIRGGGNGFEFFQQIQPDRIIYKNA